MKMYITPMKLLLAKSEYKLFQNHKA